MTIPKRKGNAPAEATQELQSLDVLELVETLKSRAEVVLPRKSIASSSSIAPVGLDLMPRRATTDEEVNPTMQVRLPARRRRLGGIVIGAIAGCTLILVAAGIARVGHASSSAESSTPSVPATFTAAVVTPTEAVPPVALPTTTSTPALPPSSGNSASTGTVRLDRPAAAGRVWLDGKKLTSSSALVSCGTHQIRVGRGRTHSVDVPCGAEIGVSK